MTSRAEYGKQAEEMAAAYLEERGYEIKARNYRIRAGEIDIVAKRYGWLVFVEVKARASVNYGYPREAVTLAKQARIIRAANMYLMETGLTESSIRFDVIEVHGSKINHWPNAFDATGN